MPFSPPGAIGGPNVAAFLDTIAYSELGARLLAESDNGYNVLVGSTPERPLLFRSYADHPNVYNAASNSTAAGRYQILRRYWLLYQQRLKLPDFSPASQDHYAVQQLREQGALPLIAAGRFADALASVRAIWASLPGAGYGQHEQPIAALQARYVQCGGACQRA
jgi:muramidase (phage lysozyme)